MAKNPSQTFYYSLTDSARGIKQKIKYPDSPRPATGQNNRFRPSRLRDHG